MRVTRRPEGSVSVFTNVRQATKALSSDVCQFSARSCAPIHCPSVIPSWKSANSESTTEARALASSPVASGSGGYSVVTWGPVDMPACGSETGAGGEGTATDSVTAAGGFLSGTAVAFSALRCRIAQVPAIKTSSAVRTAAIRRVVLGRSCIASFLKVLLADHCLKPSPVPGLGLRDFGDQCFLECVLDVQE